MFAFIDRMIISLMADPIKRDLALSDTQFGVLVSGLGVSFALMSIPFGRVADVGVRRSIIAACIAFWSLMTAFCGLAKGFFSMLLARVGVGVGEAGLGPSGVSMIADLFPRDRIAQPMAVYLVGTYLGGGFTLSLAGPLIDYFSSAGSLVVPVLGELSAWRLVFIPLGLSGLLLALVVRFTVREPQRRDHAMEVPVHHHAEPAPSHAEAIPTIRQVGAYLWDSRGLYGPMFAGFVLISAFVNAQFAWIPVFLARRFELSAGQVGMSYGIIFACSGTLATFLIGKLTTAMRRFGSNEALLRTLILGAASLMLPAVLVAIVPTVGAALLLITLATFFIAILLSIKPSVIIAFAPNRMRGQVTAIYLTCSGIIAHSGPVVVGLITDRVFGSEASVGYSIALMALLTLPAGAWLVHRSVIAVRAFAPK